MLAPLRTRPASRVTRGDPCIERGPDASNLVPMPTCFACVPWLTWLANERVTKQQGGQEIIGQQNTYYMSKNFQGRRGGTRCVLGNGPLGNRVIYSVLVRAGTRWWYWRWPSQQLTSTHFRYPSAP